MLNCYLEPSGYLISLLKQEDPGASSKEEKPAAVIPEEKGNLLEIPSYTHSEREVVHLIRDFVCSRLKLKDSDFFNAFRVKKNKLDFRQLAAEESLAGEYFSTHIGRSQAKALKVMNIKQPPALGSLPKYHTTGAPILKQAIAELNLHDLSPRNAQAVEGFQFGRPSGRNSMSAAGGPSHSVGRSQTNLLDLPKPETEKNTKPTGPKSPEDLVFESDVDFCDSSLESWTCWVKRPSTSSPSRTL